MKTNNNIPAYRFKGYTDAWEERKLKDIAQFNPKTVLPDEFEYVDLESVVGTEMISHRTESKDQAPSRAQRLAQKGDVFYQTVRPYQMNNYLYDLPYDNYVFSTGYAQMRPNIDSYFLLNSVQNKQFVQHVSDRSTGTSYPAINSSDLSKIEIHVPSKLSEQQKIGSFFKQLDDTIALHQRKLDMLKEQKKTYLKLLFPAKGQTKPVLRFQGFEDDWEKVKLGEIGETFTGLSGKTKEDFGHGEGKFITYVNVFNNPISDLLGTDRIEVDESQTNVQFGDIFFTTSSETPEEVGMSSVWLGNGNNIYLNSFCFGFRPTLKLSNHFMAYVLRSTEIRKKFIFLAQGISRYNISKTKVMNISIPLPTLPEQESIGTFFQTLDQEIAQVEDKLASLKEMKKTLLRKLFV